MPEYRIDRDAIIDENDPVNANETYAMNLQAQIAAEVTRREAAEAERDNAIKEREWMALTLRGVIERCELAEADAERLFECLSHVEGDESGDRWSSCHWCGRYIEDGHAKDCERQLVVSAHVVHLAAQEPKP